MNFRLTRSRQKRPRKRPKILLSETMRTQVPSASMRNLPRLAAVQLTNSLLMKRTLSVMTPLLNGVKTTPAKLLPLTLRSRNSIRKQRQHLQPSLLPEATKAACNSVKLILPATAMRAKATTSPAQHWKPRNRNHFHHASSRRHLQGAMTMTSHFRHHRHQRRALCRVSWSCWSCCSSSWVAPPASS